MKNKSPHIETDKERCLNVILSCRNFKQIKIAKNMCKNFKNKYKDSKDVFHYIKELNYYFKKREVVLRDYGNTLEGDRCIVISNEKDPIILGTVSCFTDFDKYNQSYIPIVTNKENKKDYVCMGVVLPFNEENIIKLNSMPIEKRWKEACKINKETSKIKKETSSL